MFPFVIGHPFERERTRVKRRENLLSFFSLCRARDVFQVHYGSFDNERKDKQTFRPRCTSRFSVILADDVAKRQCAFELFSCCPARRHPCARARRQRRSVTRRQKSSATAKERRRMLDVTGKGDRNAYFVFTLELTLYASATYQLSVRDAANEKRRSDKSRPCVCVRRGRRRRSRTTRYGKKKDERQMRDVGNKRNVIYVHRHRVCQRASVTVFNQGSIVHPLRTPAQASYVLA